MKKLPLFLAVSALSLHSSFADWVISQKTTTEGKTQDMVIKVKGDKTRADIGDQMSAITDASSGEITMFMHSQKMMMKMNADSMKGLMSLAGQLLEKAAPAAKPEATGQMEKVGDYETEIYTWKSKLGTGKFWIAKDFPGYKEINAAQDKLTKAMGNPATAFAPQTGDFPGMAVKSEMTLMGKVIISELVSAKNEPVADSTFIAPEGYKEMKIPSLPGK